MRGPGRAVAVRTAPREGKSGWWLHSVPRRGERAREPVHVRDRRAGGCAWRRVLDDGHPYRSQGNARFDGRASRDRSSVSAVRVRSRFGPAGGDSWTLFPGAVVTCPRTSIELRVCGRGGELRDFIRVHCVSSPPPRPPVVRVLGCEPRRFGAWFHVKRGPSPSPWRGFSVASLRRARGVRRDHAIAAAEITPPVHDALTRGSCSPQSAPGVAPSCGCRCALCLRLCSFVRNGVIVLERLNGLPRSARWVRSLCSRHPARDGLAVEHGPMGLSVGCAASRVAAALPSPRDRHRLLIDRSTPS